MQCAILHKKTGVRLSIIYIEILRYLRYNINDKQFCPCFLYLLKWRFTDEQV